MDKVSARSFGIFFILSFLSYGIGAGLMDIAQIQDLTPGNVLAQKMQVIIGGILVSVFHTVFNVALLVIMFNTLKSFNRYFSYFYLSMGIIATLMLALGAVCLLTSIPLSMQFHEVEAKETIVFSTFVSLISQLNFYAYQVGMAIWGLGGLCFCYLLYRSKLVPLVFPIWGYAGYLIFIAGTFFEISGINIGVLLSIPGGLFEIGLSLYLIAFLNRQS